MLTPEEILTSLQTQLPHTVSGILIYGYLKSQFKNQKRELLIAEYCLEKAFKFFYGTRKLNLSDETIYPCNKLFDEAIRIAKEDLSDI